jgi:hypothetical protein
VKGALDGSVLWVMDYGCFELRMSWIIYFVGTGMVRFIEAFQAEKLL